MNRLKTEAKFISYDSKLPSDCFKCTIDIPKDSLISITVERWFKEIGSYELKDINIAINTFEPCFIGDKNNTNRYEIFIVRLKHRENYLEFTDNYKYLCTTNCESINFMVFYKKLDE